jgi:hypothetical protein
VKPMLGSTVFYTLSEADIPLIEHRSPQRQKVEHDGGASTVYMRNPVAVGQVYPAQVVAVFGPTAANLIVQLDGYAQYWATSRSQGDEPGQYAWTLNRDLQRQDGAQPAD